MVLDKAWFWIYPHLSPSLTCSPRPGPQLAEWTGVPLHLAAPSLTCSPRPGPQLAEWTGVPLHLAGVGPPAVVHGPVRAGCSHVCRSSYRRTQRVSRRRMNYAAGYPVGAKLYNSSYNCYSSLVANPGGFYSDQCDVWLESDDVIQACYCVEVQARDGRNHNSISGRMDDVIQAGMMVGEKPTTAWRFRNNAVNSISGLTQQQEGFTLTNVLSSGMMLSRLAGGRDVCYCMEVQE
ncbi:hypothetical protein Bbelb_376450 [Branchiostoma belcheri]|nr:hypothetical protein Bbelb_376450 [Branchiostoma belcheri]